MTTNPDEAKLTAEQTAELEMMWDPMKPYMETFNSMMEAAPMKIKNEVGFYISKKLTEFIQDVLNDPDAPLMIKLVAASV